MRSNIYICTLLKSFVPLMALSFQLSLTTTASLRRCAALFSTDCQTHCVCTAFMDAFNLRKSEAIKCRDNAITRQTTVLTALLVQSPTVMRNFKICIFEAASKTLANQCRRGWRVALESAAQILWLRCRKIKKENKMKTSARLLQLLKSFFV